MGRTTGHPPDELKRAKIEAYKLRARFHWSWDRIGEQIGCTGPTARKWAAEAEAWPETAELGSPACNRPGAIPGRISALDIPYRRGEPWVDTDAGAGPYTYPTSVPLRESERE